MGFIAIHSPRIYSYSLFQSLPKKQKTCCINQLEWAPYESDANCCNKKRDMAIHGPNQRRDRVFVYSAVDIISNTLQGTNISPKDGILKMIFQTSPGGICIYSLEI